MRVALGVEYDGSPFHGFQYQSHDPLTVQARLEEALSRVAATKVSILPAGRTDAGVHASHQIIHFDTLVIRSLNAWVLGANAYLPPSIRVLWAAVVDHDFHARFSARARMYRYICLRSDVKPCLLHNKVTWLLKPVDINAMRDAARYLIGEHDFSAFRASGCQAKTPTRHLISFDISSVGDFVFFDVKANAFLQNMVRNLVGSLLQVGLGFHSSDWIGELLAQKDRRLAAATAPPFGLYLCHVDYPASFGLIHNIPRIPFFNFLSL